jgi:WhiB family redox-sensing transcriptional regulator
MLLGARHPVDTLIAKSARCADPRSTYASLFFSESPIDGARAKAICARCSVKELCLERAIARAEPFGVWGGEFVIDGQVVGIRRSRGRPPKNPPPPLVVDEVTGLPEVAIVA